MNNRKYRGKEPLRKFISCKCGSEAKLIVRRNFPFGRKSGGRTIMLYRCLNCSRENYLNRMQEVRR